MEKPTEEWAGSRAHRPAVRGRPVEVVVELFVVMARSLRPAADARKAGIILVPVGPG